jgi:hypothetical protein
MTYAETRGYTTYTPSGRGLLRRGEVVLLELLAVLHQQFGPACPSGPVGVPLLVRRREQLLDRVSDVVEQPCHRRRTRRDTPALGSNFSEAVAAARGSVERDGQAEADRTARDRRGAVSRAEERS